MPANSTLGVGVNHTPNAEITVDPFVQAWTAATYNLVPQMGSARKLDTLGDKIMTPVAYQNRGGTASLWAAQTVMENYPAGPTAINWYQFDVTGGSFPATPAQQQSWDNGGDGLFRWMPSIAVDRNGNAAIGYSTSSASMVAGISIGLVSEAGDDGQLKRYELLTDIIGSEDHYGDMDFKLCGTDVGVTGFQLDLKLPGVAHNILTEAIQRAKEARTKILEIMRSTLDQPRTELSKYAPRIETVKINPEKIGALIGPGGKTIKGIVAETGAEINIEDDGSVHIYATTGESMARAKEIIGGMTREIEIGQTYQGRVVTTKEFGAFVEVFPGKDGLVHISELADFRVKRTEDVVKVGDMIWVKCIGIDDKGRVKLSRKAALKERAETETGQAL